MIVLQWAWFLDSYGHHRIMDVSSLLLADESAVGTEIVIGLRKPKRVDIRQGTTSVSLFTLLITVAAYAEAPDQWVSLFTRVHGGFRVIPACGNMSPLRPARGPSGPVVNAKLQDLCRDNCMRAQERSTSHL